MALGARPESVVCFAHPLDAAVELAREVEGGPIHPDSPSSDGFVIGPGIRLVPVPHLDFGVPLVADVSRVYLVEREDFTVERSFDFAFNVDGIAVKVRGRFTVAAPTPAKSLRLAPHNGGGS